MLDAVHFLVPNCLNGLTPTIVTYTLQFLVPNCLYGLTAIRLSYALHLLVINFGGVGHLCYVQGGVEDKFRPSSHFTSTLSALTKENPKQKSFYT